KNNSHDGLYSVYTGVDDTSKFAKLEEWNNHRKCLRNTPKIRNPKRNVVLVPNNGGQFAPFVSKDTTLYVFSTDLCRSMSFTYETDTEVHGLKTMRFTPPPTLFASADEDENNRCFCTTPTCPKSGVVYISSCRKGAPIVLSSPHFYLGDNAYVNGVDGLSPTKELHETFLDIHPLTGLVLRASKRLQINVDLRNYDKLQVLKDVQSTVFPVAWIEESVELSPALAEQLKQKAELPQQLGNGTIATALVVGGIGSSICVVMIFLLYLQGKSRTAGISSEQLHSPKHP
ncbi:unnamed protein product, partial [Ixodes hexagonus]